MAVKSVIEIDVHDEKFKAFQASFDKYQKTLDLQQKRWAEVNKTFDQINKKQKDFNKLVQDGTKGLKDAVSVTGSIARNMASAALSAAKWVAYGAIGGGFGLGALASSASDYRRQALGLGVSTGQLRAANVAYGRAFDAQSVMGNIANMQYDPVGQATLARLGVARGANPAENLGETFKNAVALFEKFGKNPVFAKNLGLTDVFSLEDLRRGSNMAAKELDEMAEQFQKDKKLFELDDKVSKAWQDFWYALKENANVLEVNFLRALKNLVPELTKFAKWLTKGFVSILKSEQLQDAIKGFIKIVAAPETKETVKTFLEGVKLVGQVLYDLASLINDTFGLENRRARSAELEEEKQRGYDPMRWAKDLRPSVAERNLNPGNLRFIGQNGAVLGDNNFAKFRDWQSGFSALNSQLSLYETGQSKAAGYRKLQTIADIIPVYAPKEDKNDVEAYIRYVAKQSGFGATDQLNISDPNTNYKLMSAIANYEIGKGNQFTPQGIQVIINNNTGNNAVATAAALQK